MDHPVEADALPRLEVGLLSPEPFELDFEVAAGVGGRRERPKPAPHPLGRGTPQVRPIRAAAASQAAKPDSKVV